ncbi:hypothetical protein BDZ94DRAFT_378833 [Collybia nuda]|uniref:Uncharacterized protein n=1 Tax=Collybia nuda TaxID=64659 RepID=A0A9P5YGA0_9AGAR|nr:hypothetical protein BDZ94DRAFT_378833 [Collybia nuda]
MFWKRGLIFLALLFIFLGASIAIELNRTIDDTLGDSITGTNPNYFPASGVWENAACKDCVLQPDGILAFKGTWAAATYDPTLNSMSIELAFKGTAIYIFFILADIVEQGLQTETACNFTLDGQPAGFFSHTPAPNNEFLYNSLVFSQRDLPNIDHQFRISTSGLNRRVWVNFDYAIYTVDDAPPPPPSTSSSSKSSTLSVQSSVVPVARPSQPSISPLPTDSESPFRVAAILGGIIGGFVFFFSILLLFLFYRRRRQQNAEQSDDEFPEPVLPTSSGYRNSDSDARFITPFINPSLFPHGSNDQPLSTLARQEAPATMVGSSAVFDASYPPNMAHQASGPLPMLMLASDRTIPSASTCINPVSTSNYAPSVPSRTSVRVLKDRITAISQDVQQAGSGRQLRTATQEMRNSSADSYITTAHRQTSVVYWEETSHMREQIRMMKEQIDYLQGQRQTH